MRAYIIKIERGNENMRIFIDRIAINGFKNINHANIVFDKITSLLSVNSYGKSNLLTAIDFGISFIGTSKIGKNKMFKFAPGFPLNKANVESNFQFEIELTVIEKKKFSVIYGYSFEWNSLQNKRRGILSEYFKIKEADESKYSMFISRNADHMRYRSSLSGRCSKSIKVENDELILNKISNYDDLYYLDIVKAVNEIKVYVERHFDSGPFYDPRPYIERDIDDLMITDNKNIPRVLHRIKTDYPDKFAAIVNTIKSIFPFIIDLKIQELKIEEQDFKTNLSVGDPYFELVDKVYFLYAIHENMVIPIEFSEMSDGVKRILLLYTYIILAQINDVSLIAIEEPENSIHPGLLKKYIIALDSFLENTRVLITSHSPFLVNYIKTESLYIGIPNEEGLAIFRKIKESSVSKIYSDADELDMLVGEYLFDLMSVSSNTNTLLKYINNE